MLGLRQFMSALTLMIILFSMSGCQERDAVPPKGEMTGEKLFIIHCSGCHAEGGNMMNAEKPITGSSKLASFATFQTFIQDPGPGMPGFSETMIPAAEAKKLYDYIQANYGKP